MCVRERDTREDYLKAFAMQGRTHHYFIGGGMRRGGWYIERDR